MGYEVFWKWQLCLNEQTLFDDANDLLSLLIDKEMVAFEHAYATAAGSLFAPAFEFLFGRSVILRSTYRRDRTLQLRAGNEVVVAANREIGAQHRYQKLHQLRVVEHFLWGSVQPLDFGDKLRLGKSVDLGITLGHLGSAPAGNKQMIGFEAAFRTQPAR